jgi:hypothetical protein
MKRDVFKEKLKKNLIIQAPEGMTNKIMDAIEIESKQVSYKSDYSMPGKLILVGLSLFFLFTVIWSFLYRGNQTNSIVERLPKFTIQVPELSSFTWLFTNLNSYLMIGFLLFVVLEFIQFRRNSFRIN